MNRVDFMDFYDFRSSSQLFFFIQLLLQTIIKHIEIKLPIMDDYMDDYTDDRMDARSDNVRRELTIVRSFKNKQICRYISYR